MRQIYKVHPGFRDREQYFYHQPDCWSKNVEVGCIFANLAKETAMPIIRPEPGSEGIELRGTRYWWIAPWLFDFAEALRSGLGILGSLGKYYSFLEVGPFLEATFSLQSKPQVWVLRTFLLLRSPKNHSWYTASAHTE